MAELLRRRFRVRGAVQGVGYRPFVYRLATELALAGWVYNDGDGVAIEAQGCGPVLADFERRLRGEAPPLARVESVDSSACEALAGEAGFRILASRTGAVHTSIPPDTATCDDCLDEMLSSADRRWRYAFINCTQCGPRYTITRALPYDRAQTSMAAFAQCPACLAEYRDPASRRFHAEPNACPLCGPQLALSAIDGRPIEGDAIARSLDLLRSGAIVAVKGLGGFHLVCDARNAEAVARLRERKQREEKAFAVMAANVASAARWVALDESARALLESPARPIVLLPRLDPAALPGIAPGLDSLGLMLPCTPIQTLLFFEAAGRPPDPGWRHEAQELLLVMTSANPGGEPILTDDAEAFARLGSIADAALGHGRAIVARCDDSVLRGGGARPQFVRRARGWTPQPIRLPRAGPSVLATGAWLKNTICVTRGDEAFLSPHIGDLDNPASCRAHAEAVDHLCAVLDVRPRGVAHDLHPDFYSTRFAQEYAGARGLPLLAVQHHHAHIAAVAAEHRHQGPLLGLALDGVGLGSDGSAWGGELLRVDGASFMRLGHLARIALPGGDIAAREPWRMAAAALQRIGRGARIAERFAGRAQAAGVAALLQRGRLCPPTTSLGRWFDAAAGLLGVRATVAYEGQAAMLLEALADGPAPAESAIEGLLRIEADGTLALDALVERLADETDARRGATLFHHALAAGLARWVGAAAASTGLRRVALGGGCFLNRRLSALLCGHLGALGLDVLEAGRAPPNDGAIALGQAWVALCAADNGWHKVVRHQVPIPPSSQESLGKGIRKG